jgi:anti-sigma regulatory factor (Ser/Thr protein kinase)
MRRRVVLSPDEHAPRLARAALEATVPPPELGDRYPDAELAIAELTSNAVRHAGLGPHRQLEVVIAGEADRLRIEVVQPTHARDVAPVEPRFDRGRVGGFGLKIIDSSADAWGVDPGPPGRVWVEFRR